MDDTANLDRLVETGIPLRKAIAMGPAGVSETTSGKAPAKPKSSKPKMPKVRRGKSSY